MAVICPRTSVEIVGGHITTVAHMLAMAFDDPTMDDLRAALAGHEIVLGEEWADVDLQACRLCWVLEAVDALPQLSLAPGTDASTH